MFVDAYSSMDVMDTITFRDNTIVHLIYGPGVRIEYMYVLQ